MTTEVQEFKDQATKVTADLRHRKLIQTALGKYEVARDKRKGAFQSWSEARQVAAETKWDAINHLDEHLVSFADKLEARGTKVHWATTAARLVDLYRSLQ